MPAWGFLWTPDASKEVSPYWNPLGPHRTQRGRGSCSCTLSGKNVKYHYAGAGWRMAMTSVIRPTRITCAIKDNIDLLFRVISKDRLVLRQSYYIGFLKRKDVSLRIILLFPFQARAFTCATFSGNTVCMVSVRWWLSITRFAFLDISRAKSIPVEKQKAATIQSSSE